MTKQIGTRYEECPFCGCVTHIDVFEGDGRDGEYDLGEPCQDCQVLEDAAIEAQFEKDMLECGNFVKCECCLEVLPYMQMVDGLCQKCDKAFREEDPRWISY